MKKQAFFAFLSRMKYINRWGLMRNLRAESLSEHSFECAMLANALAHIENTYYGGTYDVDKITAAALFHDSAEIITGDMPTPVKYYSSSIRAAYDQVEGAAKKTLLETLAPRLRGIYEQYLNFDKSPEYEIIKAADKLAALIKCIEENTGGNRDFDDARKATQSALDKIQLQSIGHFIECFLPCYGENLDRVVKGEPPYSSC